MPSRHVPYCVDRFSGLTAAVAHNAIVNREAACFQPVGGWRRAQRHGYHVGRDLFTANQFYASAAPGVVD